MLLSIPNSIGKTATRCLLHRVSLCRPVWGIEGHQSQHATLAGLSGGPGWWGDWLHGFRLVGFLLTRCRLLARGIWLVLFQAGDLESNSGPDRGPCVVCGQTPAENARALLWCTEGCGRESHYKEACSGLQRGSSIKGTGHVGCLWWLMGGGSPQSNLVKCRHRRHLANPLVKGLPLVNRDLLVRPNHIISRSCCCEGCCAGRCGSVPPQERRLGWSCYPKSWRWQGWVGADPRSGPGI
jgi:hypothetical protein